MKVLFYASVAVLFGILAITLKSKKQSKLSLNLERKRNKTLPYVRFVHCD